MHLYGRTPPSIATDAYFSAFVRPRKPIPRRRSHCNFTVYNSLYRPFRRVLFLFIGLVMKFSISYHFLKRLSSVSIQKRIFFRVFRYKTVIWHDFITRNADSWFSLLVPAHNEAFTFTCNAGKSALIISALLTTQISVQVPTSSTSV